MAPRKNHPVAETKIAQHLVIGDVVVLSDSELAVVTWTGSSPQTYHQSVQMTVLRHLYDDRWVRTSKATHRIFDLEEKITLLNSVRVREKPNRGPFQTYAERKEDD